MAFHPLPLLVACLKIVLKATDPIANAGMCTAWQMLGSMLLFYAVKSELTYNNLNRTFKVSEVFKEWFYQFHPSVIFHGRTQELNQGLQSPSPLLYPLHWISYAYLL